MIEVEHVTKYYGATPAVRDLHFTIEEGECVGFLGLNGAGKSTTLRLLSCLLLPTAGRIRIRGIDAEREPHRIRRFVGFLPDTPPLYDDMTVEGFVAYAGRLRGMDGAALRRRLPEVLQTCGLTEVAGEPVAVLSHGYRQRVGIAQAVVHEPALLVLDEPVQGLDPVQIVEMREMIRALRGRHTILLSTHLLAEVEQTCDRILMLEGGRIAAQGTEEELLARFGGGQRLEVEARAEGADPLRCLLEGLDGVEHVRVRALGEGFFVAEVSARGEVREAISRSLIEAGMGLRGLRRLSSGLEDVFVRLGEADSGSGHGGAARGAAPREEGEADA